MTGPRRRAADRLALVLGVAVALITAAGCSPTTRASSPPASSTGTPASSVAVPSAPAPGLTAAPSLTAVPGGTAGTEPSASIPSTTSTEFGDIFDALPPSFPTLPGQQPADTAGEATSGSFAVNMEVGAAVTAVQTALQAQGWTVDVGSPLEDGAVVLDAAGPTVGCKAQVRFTPTSGTVVMSVLYGAACPFA